MASYFRLYTCTWNVAQSSPPADLKPLLGLDSGNEADLYAVGLQEQQAGLTQLSDYFVEDPWTTALTECLGFYDYVRVTNIRTVGINLIVFLRRSLLPFLKDIETTCTRAQFGGLWGGKGAVSVSFGLAGVDVCLVNSHLAAHRPNVAERLQQFNLIVESQTFTKKSAPAILDHDYILWFGDLNFRIDDVSTERVKGILRASDQNDLNFLLENDQLIKSMDEHIILVDFLEGQIKFQPTYKFDPGTDTYDTSSKQRRPAWCDRILWQKNPIDYESFTLDMTQHHYDSHPGYKNSDHKPVSASFSIKVFESKPYLPVKFDNVHNWSGQENGYFHFTVNDIKISNWDWVGLFKTDFKDLSDYMTYVWLGKPGETREALITGAEWIHSYVHGSYLQNLEASSSTYCLIYWSSAKNCPLGYSNLFEINGKKTEISEK